jgi:tellurium resistance protein TerD
MAPEIKRYDGIVLRKDQGVTLSKSTGIERVMIGFGWDINPEIDVTLDAETFLLNAAGKVRRSTDVIFYGATEHVSGSVIHIINKGCDSDGDDDIIIVDITKIPDDIQRIVFTVTIYDEDGEGLTFAGVESAYIRLINISKAPAKKLLNVVNDMRDSMDDGPYSVLLGSLLYSPDNENIARFKFADFSDDSVSLEIAELVRKGSDWDFVALGNGVKGDLAALCAKYGVKVN